MFKKKKQKEKKNIQKKRCYIRVHRLAKMEMSQLKILDITMITIRAGSLGFTSGVTAPGPSPCLPYNNKLKGLIFL